VTCYKSGVVEAQCVTCPSDLPHTDLVVWLIPSARPYLYRGLADKLQAYLQHRPTYLWLSVSTLSSLVKEACFSGWHDQLS